ncbi:MAG: BNR repeat-containing protein [Glaciecola sp.]
MDIFNKELFFTRTIKPLMRERLLFILLFNIATYIWTFSVHANIDHSVVVESEAIDNVWSGHRVSPALITRGNEQFVAYYDSNRQMTIAHRKIGTPWRYYKLDSWVGWDSHNYVTIELDKDGYLHVLGNLHSDAIEYFRMSEPLKVRSLKRISVMVDPAVERKMTYPIFLKNKNDELIAKYRDGGSGNGNEIYNIYDTQTKTWRRLHDNQFLDGEGKRSGYFEGPTLGPDGNFHLIWVWRDTPDASTNHSLSYARSSDLVNWEDSTGKRLQLPIRHSTAEIVDPVGVKGGMINGNIKLGFDQGNNPIISYHKYGKNGNTQMFVARSHQNDWQVKQISQWTNFRWDFGGGGSLGRFPIKPHTVEVLNNNTLSVLVRKEDDIFRFVIDSDSLETLEVQNADLYPQQIETITTESNRMLFESSHLPFEHRVFKGKGDLSAKSGQFYLSLHSQPSNRDRAHKMISMPSVLLLHEAIPK